MKKTLTILKNKPLKDVCTFGIGGPASYFVEIHTIEHAQEALSFARGKDLPFHVLGKGSNTLFDDSGFDGLVISNKIDFYQEITPGTFSVGAGYSFSLLGVQTARKGWTGLEFASGIPASVGGAVFMNAGANGHETAKVLTSVTFLTAEGSTEIHPRENLAFSYRHSPFQQRKGIILSASFQLSMLEEARKKQLEIIEYRKSTQPYKDKSAGCVFRNPPGHSAGALIERTGLKGASVGGAAVSEKHANFFINTKNSTSADMQHLISLVQQKVKETQDVELECEIRYVPPKTHE